MKLFLFLIGLSLSISLAFAKTASKTMGDHPWNNDPNFSMLKAANVGAHNLKLSIGDDGECFIRPNHGLHPWSPSNYRKQRTGDKSDQ